MLLSGKFPCVQWRKTEKDRNQTNNLPNMNQVHIQYHYTIVALEHGEFEIETFLAYILHL